MAYHKIVIFSFFKDASEDALGDHYTYTLAIFDYCLTGWAVYHFGFFFLEREEVGKERERGRWWKWPLGTCHMAMSIILASFVVL